MTFREMYQSLPSAERHPSPKALWISEIAALTEASENTVRMWISGIQKPLPLAQSVIAERLGVPREELFDY